LDVAQGCHMGAIPGRPQALRDEFLVGATGTTNVGEDPWRSVWGDGYEVESAWERVRIARVWAVARHPGRGCGRAQSGWAPVRGPL
jgi:hypothetical protein